MINIIVVVDHGILVDVSWHYHLFDILVLTSPPGPPSTSAGIPRPFLLSFLCLEPPLLSFDAGFVSLVDPALFHFLGSPLCVPFNGSLSDPI
jgi:hypothetical protein